MRGGIHFFQYLMNRFNGISNTINRLERQPFSFKLPVNHKNVLWVRAVLVAASNYPFIKNSFTGGTGIRFPLVTSLPAAATVSCSALWCLVTHPLRQWAAVMRFKK
jgi:hypothetical protein